MYIKESRLHEGGATKISIQGNSHDQILVLETHSIRNMGLSHDLNGRGTCEGSQLCSFFNLHAVDPCRISAVGDEMCEVKTLYG